MSVRAFPCFESGRCAPEIVLNHSSQQFHVLLTLQAPTFPCFESLLNVDLPISLGLYKLCTCVTTDTDSAKRVRKLVNM